MLHDVNESQGLLDKKIIEELCELHEKELFKGCYDFEFINSIESYLEKNQLKSFHNSLHAFYG
ncbi:1977_t:CDS:2 [Cetraspora pellucida]|uniref:1977_t:CDS:1 n=1 Tax=Cetraspora pellucida TaxID=1433469 RepID=A0A9N9ATP7_9GLOM|nr:1977_t:CDS:2 [Cetraspora pellucida]